MENKEQKADDIQALRRLASENPKAFMNEMDTVTKELKKLKSLITGWSLVKTAADFHYDPLKWVKSHESKP